MGIHPITTMAGAGLSHDHLLFFFFFTGDLHTVSGKQKPHSAVSPNANGTYRIQGFKSLAGPQKAKH